MASASTGSTCSSMKARTRSSRSVTRSEGAKSTGRGVPTAPCSSHADQGHRAAAAQDHREQHERVRSRAGRRHRRRERGAVQQLARELGAGLGHHHVARARRRGSPARRSRRSGAARSARPPRAGCPGSARPRPGCARRPRAPGRPPCRAGSILRARPCASLSGCLDRLAAGLHERRAATRAEVLAPGRRLAHAGQWSGGSVLDDEVFLLHRPVRDAPCAHRRARPPSETIR